jgi:hypothetical protein
VTTDTAATVAQVIERYAARWSIETAIEDAKQVFGTGQARNRAARAVERSVPFQIACQAIALTWYTTKEEPSTSDMAVAIRRVLIAARFKATRPGQPTPQEIHAIRLAWEDAAT